MPQSPSSSSRAPRPSPFPHGGSSFRPGHHSASRSKSTSPTNVELAMPNGAVPHRQTFQQEEYQNFGFPMPTANFHPMHYGMNGNPAYQQAMAHSTVPTPEFLQAPFAFAESSTALTSPILSGPSSFTSNSPDREFLDRYDDSPERDADDDDRLPPSTRETTPPPLPAQPKTRRPPNAWILYRSDRIREYNKLGSLASFAASRPAVVEEEEEDSARKPAKKTTNKVSKGPPQAEISRIIAEQWKKEPKDVKAKYDRLAEIKKMEHQRDYPDYKYQPMKKEDKIKLKQQKDKEKALLKKEKALNKAMRPRKPRTRTHAARSQAIPGSPSAEVKVTPTEKSDGQPVPRHLTTRRSPRKDTKKPRKGTGKGKDSFEGNDNGFLDGHQVFWGIVPELPNSYVAPEPIDTESRAGNPEASGPSTAQTAEFSSAQTPQDFWKQPYPDLPPAEAGLAIDSQSIVPYIFEPAPFPDLSGGPTYQSLNSSQPDYHGQYEELANSVLQQEPLPPVEIPGVTESELAEMWGLLEDDTTGTDNGGVDGRQTVNWAADPAELVNQWADLSVPIEDASTYISPRNFSGSVASQIASDYHNQPYHSLQPDLYRGPHSATGYHHPQPYQNNGYPQPQQYSSSRPGYVTIEVPVSSLQQSYAGRPPAYSSMPHGPPLNQAPQFSPLNGSFPGIGAWAGSGSDSHASFAPLDRPDGRGRRSYEHNSPFSTAALPLDTSRSENQNHGSNLPTPNYMQSIDGAFGAMQDRRVSGVSPIDADGWISPTDRTPSFGDWRVPSGNFVSFPEHEFDLPQDALVEPVHQKAPIKKGRVVAGQHAPPPQIQRVAS